MMHGSRSFAVAVFAFTSTLFPNARATVPPLQEIIERARVHGPAALLAAADVRVAGATRHAAGLPPLTNPYLELIVDRGKYTDVVTVESKLFLPVELAGQGGKRLREVDAMVQWKQMARSGAAATSVGEAVVAYGELLVESTRLREAMAGEKIAREEAAYIQGRFAASDATAVDKSLAEGELGRWLLTRSEAELAQSLAHARLSIAIGDPDLGDPEDSESANLPALRWKDSASLATHLKANSPMLRSASLEAEFFGASRERWEAEKSAPVNFIIAAGRGDAGELRYGAGLAWTFPVFRRNQGEIARAEAEQSRALASRTIVAGAIEARARGLFAAYSTARSALSTIDTQSMPAARAVVDASMAAWRAGKLDLTRVFLARRDLATAQTRRLDLVAAGWRAYGDLAGLVGDQP